MLYFLFLNRNYIFLSIFNQTHDCIKHPVAVYVTNRWRRMYECNLLKRFQVIDYVIKPFCILYTLLCSHSFASSARFYVNLSVLFWSVIRKLFKIPVPTHRLDHTGTGSGENMNNKRKNRGGSLRSVFTLYFMQIMLFWDTHKSINHGYLSILTVNYTANLIINR